ncbi:guanylate kinase [Ruminococcus sp. Marseille-P6503]|uniref:guanylate kinase n=1 Tax=Ruminococcus sp. Marseille-P6503 TaxID=2364796 RepID=UPI000F524140|nr:guanylate kinase [Ruminococcus sp. Marseille-P6503]
MNKARLFVVSAPSGCGKGTILGEVFKNSDVFYSVSCTTRDPREGEVDGVHYHFIDDAQFEKTAAENGFLEYAGFVKHYYGTPAEPVIRNLSEGRDVVLEIETNGAFQVKKAMPEAVLIFILPPSVDELKRRLNKRGTESEAVIAERVKAAADEIAKAYDYDYAIMNDGLEDAVRDFETVMRAAKNDLSDADMFRTSNKTIKNMINEVLKNA